MRPDFNEKEWMLITYPAPCSGMAYIILRGLDGTKWVYTPDGWKKVGWLGFLFPWWVR